ncbi:MAG TPA: HAD-IIA family hydrolase [Eubacteriales bacterium]|jgi:NagD protein|nr:HAD-IIA family hydrolase [Clostridia bacterium]HRR89261.1 HAD-IIA family hydrolase [Eubacteriales bacterium]HRU83901.1 HAD-IIA family hydrolase [Eubacteriales bacterium]
MKDLTGIELFLLDLDGTIYIGESEIEGSFDTIRKIREAGKKVCFFTNNSSRAHTDYIDKLGRMGLSIDETEIYTSGQVTAEFLSRNFQGKRVFLLGNKKLKQEFSYYDIEVVETKPDVLVLGFDTTLTYNKLNRFCKFLASGAPYIATHPDLNCPDKIAPMPDVGAMTELIRLTVGRSPDYIMGKPYTYAGDAIMQRYNLPAEKIAMVGDRLYTDIQFAINNKFASVLVLSGETTPGMAALSPTKADFTLNSFKEIFSLTKAK